MSKESITISIPAFNEEQTLEDVVNEALLAVKELTDDYELFLINDGSTDKTKQIMERLVKKNKRIRVVHHKRNKGFSAVIGEGLKGSSKDLVFLAPADGQFNFNQLKKFVKAIEGHDVAVACRVRNAEPFNRKVQSFVYHISAKLLFNIHLKEFSSVYLWRTTLLKDIKVISSPSSNTAQIELFYKAQRKGARFVQVPISWNLRKGGRPKGVINLRLIITTFREMFKLYLKERLKIS